MKKFQSGSANQTTNSSYTNWLWDYGKQALKGIGVMGVGVLGYMGLRGYWQTQSASTQAKAESSDLVAASDTSTAIFDKGLKGSTSSSASDDQSVWDGAASRTVRYRRKRDVNAPVTVKGMAVEYLTNTVTVYDQASPTVCLLENGNYAVFWTSIGQGGSVQAVVGNYFGQNGEPLKSGEFLVNSISGLNSVLSCTQVPDGVAAFWQNSNDGFSDINGQVVDANSNLISSTDFVFSDDTPFYASFPYAAALKTGNTSALIYLNWFDFLNQRMIGRLYSYNSIAKTLTSLTPSNLLQQGAVGYSMISDQTNNNFILGIYWNGGGLDPSGYGCYAIRVNAAGNFVGSYFLLNTNTAGNQWYPYLVKLKSGFQAFWVDALSDGSNSEIYTNVYSDSNVKLNNFDTLVNSFTIGIQQFGAGRGRFWFASGEVAIALPDDSVIVTWNSINQDENDGGAGIYASWFKKTQRIGREFQVNRYTKGDQILSSVVASADGSKVFFFWQSQNQVSNSSGYDIYNMMLYPRLDPYIYNTDSSGVSPAICYQNVPCLISNLVLNPMVDADHVTVTLELPPLVGNFNTPNATSFNYGNATSVYDLASHILTITNNGTGIGPVSINNLFPQLVFTPAPWYSGSFTVNVRSTDNRIHPDFNSTLTVQVNPVDYHPVLTVQQFTVDQGTPLTLTSSMFNAINPDLNVSRPISYQADRVLQARIINKQSILDIFRFGDQDLASGNVDLVPDESGRAPSFDITATDTVTGLSSNTTAANIFYNARPIINANQLTINYKQTVTVGSNQFALNVTDDHTNLSNITLYAQSTDGSFMKGGLQITSFTQGQVWSGEISFRTSGTNVPTKITLIANDVRINSTASETLVSFQSNMPPVVTLNSWDISNNGSIVAAPYNLNGTDDFTPWRELRAYVVKAEHCQFITSIGSAISSFTFGELADGLIRVEQDGSSNSPVISFVLQDDQYNSTVSSAAVSFTFRNPPVENSVQVDNRATIGGAIGGTGAALLLAGAGIFGAYRYRRSKQLEDQRSNYPLANALYHELNIAGTDDFQSEKGIAFTNAVDSLNNELIRAGVDIKQMVPEEIEELAHKLSNAIKAQLGKNINPLDIQDYAQSIVATVMTLSGKRKLDGRDVELDVVVRRT